MVGRSYAGACRVQDYDDTVLAGFVVERKRNQEIYSNDSLIEDKCCIGSAKSEMCPNDGDDLS